MLIINETVSKQSDFLEPKSCLCFYVENLLKSFKNLFQCTLFADL